MPIEDNAFADDAVATALRRLAALVSPGTPRDAATLIPAILDVLADTLDAGAAMLARLDGDTLRIEYARRRSGIAVRAGLALPLTATYCGSMLASGAHTLNVDDSRAAESPTPAAMSMFGAQAYSGMVVGHSDGTLYGTLSLLFAHSRTVHAGETDLLALAAHLITQAIEAEMLRDSALLLQREYALMHGVAADAERLRAAYDAVACGIVVQDATGAVIYANDAALEMLGLTFDQMRGLASPDPHWRAMREDDARFSDEEHPSMAALRTARPVRNVTMSLSLPAGARRWVQMDAVPVLAQDGAVTQVVGSFTDITARKLAEETLARMAHHDALTGLPNRALFHDRLTQALAHARRYGETLALLFLDLDGFKAVNDALGHDIGDMLLQAVAQRLRSCTRDSDTVARLAGDEFTVILPSIGTAEDAAVVATKIVRALRASYSLAGHNVSVTSSVGIALYPHDGPGAESLLKCADTAMYHAKKGGKNVYCFYTLVSKAG